MQPVPVELAVPLNPLQTLVEPPEDGGTIPCADLGVSYASGLLVPTRLHRITLGYTRAAPELGGRSKPARGRDGATPGTATGRRSLLNFHRQGRRIVISLEGGSFCDDYAVPCIRPIERPRRCRIRTARGWFPTNGGLTSMSPATRSGTTRTGFDLHQRFRLGRGLQGYGRWGMPKTAGTSPAA